MFSIVVMFLTPFERPFTGTARAPTRSRLRGRQHPRSELVLQPVDDEAVRVARLVAGLEIEEGEAFPARRVPLGTRQRQGHLRGRRRREPLGSVKPPGVALEPGHGFARGHVGPPDTLGHPLTRGPGAGGVARGQARQRPGGEVGVSGDEEGLCRAVGHRERARGDARRGLEEVDERKLMEAREGAVLPFVWKGDEALLGRDPERLLPEARQLDPVDAASPGGPTRSGRGARPRPP